MVDDKPAKTQDELPKLDSTPPPGEDAGPTRVQETPYGLLSGPAPSPSEIERAKRPPLQRPSTALPPLPLPLTRPPVLAPARPSRPVRTLTSEEAKKSSVPPLVPPLLRPRISTAPTLPTTIVEDDAVGPPSPPPPSPPRFPPPPPRPKTSAEPVIVAPSTEPAAASTSAEPSPKKERESQNEKERAKTETEKEAAAADVSAVVGRVSEPIPFEPGPVIETPRLRRWRTEITISVVSFLVILIPSLVYVLFLR